MEELSKAERDALQLVSIGAMQIRLIASLLPDSAERKKILALSEGMHNIPMILAGSADERQANAFIVESGVQEIRDALGPNRVVAFPATARLAI